MNKGQFALIPVSIFLQQELNAAEDVVVDQDEETITPSEVGGEQKGGENTSSKEKKWICHIQQKLDKKLLILLL